MRIVKRIWLWGKRVHSALVRHKYTTIAGTLAFFLVLSVFPLAFLFTLLFGKFSSVAEGLLSLELFEWASGLLTFFRDQAEAATAGVGIAFLATTLWSASSFFYHLRRSGEIVYQYQRKKHGWKVRLSALILTFLIILYFAAVGAVVLVVQILTRPFPDWASYCAVYFTVATFGFFTAWILNAYVCPYHCRPSETLKGSLITAVLWLLASVAFSVYLGFGNKEKLYGALTAVIVFLLWLYWMMICFTAGIIYNSRKLKTATLEHKKL